MHLHLLAAPTPFVNACALICPDLMVLPPGLAARKVGLLSHYIREMDLLYQGRFVEGLPHFESYEDIEHIAAMLKTDLEEFRVGRGQRSGVGGTCL